MEGGGEGGMHVLMRGKGGAGMMESEPARNGAGGLPALAGLLSRT